MTNRLLIAFSIVILFTAGCATPPANPTTVDSSEKAKILRELAYVKQIAIGCLMFAMQHNDMLPSQMADLKPKLGSLDLNQFELVQKGKLSEAKQDSVLVKSRTIWPQHGRAVAYVDGSAEMISEK
jgi:hypothetical protein